MKLFALFKPTVFFCFSAAGVALAFQACLRLLKHEWHPGLEYAGWSIYLVLLPFINYPALRTISTKSLSLDDARDPSLRLLPGNLGFLGFFGLVLLVAGGLINIAG
jgi:hypothetical protein